MQTVMLIYKLLAAASTAAFPETPPTCLGTPAPEASRSATLHTDSSVNLCDALQVTMPFAQEQCLVCARCVIPAMTSFTTSL